MVTGPLVQTPPLTATAGAVTGAASDGVFPVLADMLPVPGDVRPATSRAPHVRVDGVAFDRLTEVEVIARVLRDLELGRGGLLLTPNVDILRQLRRPRDADLAHRARLVVADGTPIVWASRVLGDPLPERVTGASLIWTLSAAAAAADANVMLIGGQDGVAERAAARLQACHPAIDRVGWHFPPFGFDTAAGGLDPVIEAIAGHDADVVFLGLGFPRQERVAIRLAAEFPRTWFVGCGGAITLLAGDLTRAPAWMQNAGLEWVHRLVQEPQRLVRRYLVDDAPFTVGMLARAGVERLVGQRGTAGIPQPRTETMTLATVPLATPETAGVLVSAPAQLPHPRVIDVTGGAVDVDLP